MAMSKLILPIAVACALTYWRFRQRSRTCKCRCQEEHLTVVITGATGGIGKELVKEFLLRDSKVIMAVKNLQKARNFTRAIRKQIPHRGSLTILYLDLMSFDSVRNFAANIKNLEEHIDVLINNAAIYENKREPMSLTRDGFETHFQVNYLSQYLLTILLSDLLGNLYVKGRIINVSSSLCNTMSSFSLDDINFVDTRYSSKLAYIRSKFALTCFSRSLPQYLRMKSLNCSVYCVQPGMCATDMHERHAPNRFFFLIWKVFVLLFFKTPREAAQSIIHCALNSHLADESGCLYSNCAFKPWPTINVEPFCKSLMQFSKRVCLIDKQI